MNVLIRWSQLKGLTSVCVFIWILKLDACVMCIQVKEWLLERSEKKIKIVNCNFHNQITDHVTVLISEQFLESWLGHFPFVKLAKREVQTNKQTKIEIFNFHNQILTDITAMNKFLFYTFCGEVLPLLRNLSFLRYIKCEKALYKMRKIEKTTFHWLKVSRLLTMLSCHRPVSEQLSYHRFVHQRCLFWNEEKQWKWLFLTLKLCNFAITLIKLVRLLANVHHHMYLQCVGENAVCCLQLCGFSLTFPHCVLP